MIIELPVVEFLRTAHEHICAGVIYTHPLWANAYINMIT